MSEAEQARLETIKRDGRARRSHRHRRNTLVSVFAAALVVSIGAFAVTANQTDPAPQAARPATPAGPCAESTDPACGPMRWTRQPDAVGDLTLRLRIDPDPAAAGDDVGGVVKWADPDAPKAELLSVCWGDSDCARVPPPCPGEQAYGRWAPPTPKAGKGAFELGSHRYVAPGEYVVSVTVRSAAWPLGRCPEASIDPFAQTQTVRAQVVVQ